MALCVLFATASGGSCGSSAQWENIHFRGCAQWRICPVAILLWPSNGCLGSKTRYEHKTRNSHFGCNEWSLVCNWRKSFERFLPPWCNACRMLWPERWPVEYTPNSHFGGSKRPWLCSAWWQHLPCGRLQLEYGGLQVIYNMLLSRERNLDRTRRRCSRTVGRPCLCDSYSALLCAIQQITPGNSGMNGITS